MSYKNLEIWKLADELIAEIHEMTLTKLPKFEMFEEGSQIRRSINLFIKGVDNSSWENRSITSNQ